MVWNKHLSILLKGLASAQLPLSAERYSSYPMLFLISFSLLRAPLKQQKSSSYADWEKQKALKTARATAGLLFSSVFGLQIRPFIIELDLVNIPNVLIKIKIQMLHCMTPLLQFLIQFFSFGKCCMIREVWITLNLLSHKIMHSHSFLNLKPAFIFNAKKAITGRNSFLLHQIMEPISKLHFLY